MTIWQLSFNKCFSLNPTSSSITIFLNDKKRCCEISSEKFLPRTDYFEQPFRVSNNAIELTKAHHEDGIESGLQSARSCRRQQCAKRGMIISPSYRLKNNAASYKAFNDPVGEQATMGAIWFAYSWCWSIVSIMVTKVQQSIFLKKNKKKRFRIYFYSCHNSSPTVLRLQNCSALANWIDEDCACVPFLAYEHWQSSFAKHTLSRLV